MFSTFFLIYIVIWYPLLSNGAVNDWSKPCFQGVCSYDVMTSTTSMGGYVTINGSSSSISDITEVTGWKITDCDAGASSQNISLICQSGDMTSAGCGHLLETGAEGKIIRLPESCGKSPFAHVSYAWTASDQTNQTDSSSVARKIRARAGNTQPHIYILSIDTNFTSANPSKGPVSLYIQGSTIPSLNENITLFALSEVSETHTKRSLKGFIDSSTSSLENANSFNKTLDTSSKSINVNQSFPLFNTSIECGEDKASIDLSADVSLSAYINLGFVAAGTLIPPEISEFAVYTGLSADLEGTLNLDATAADDVDLGTITLFQIGVPGLDIPGILTVGPSFKIDAKADVDIETDVKTSIGLSYHVDNLELIFPPTDGTQSHVNSSSPENSSFTLSISPNTTTNLTFEAHLIPTLDLGVNAFDGTASATIFLDLDTLAELELSLTDIGQAQTFTAASNSSHTLSSGTNACVDLKSGVSIDAGAQGSLFDLFDAETQVPLFSKDFDLFQKCFGPFGYSSTNKQRRRRYGRLFKRGALCLNTIAEDLISLVDD